MPADAALVDTNVLIYALDPQSEYHSASRNLLDRARVDDVGLCVTPQVLAEFYAVVTDRRRVPQARQPAETLDVIDQILSLPGITLLPTSGRHRNPLD
jgi:predicted nucleic acid-binding protein